MFFVDRAHGQYPVLDPGLVHAPDHVPVCPIHDFISLWRKKKIIIIIGFVLWIVAFSGSRSSNVEDEEEPEGEDLDSEYDEEEDDDRHPKKRKKKERYVFFPILKILNIYFLYKLNHCILNDFFQLWWLYY